MAQKEHDYGCSAYGRFESGYRVLSVEANPVLVQRADKRFAAHVKSGQLTCVHAVISLRQQALNECY